MSLCTCLFAENVEENEHLKSWTERGGEISGEKGKGMGLGRVTRAHMPSVRSQMAGSSGGDLQAPIFNGDNYEFWKIQMRTIFKSHGLWDLVEKGLGIS
ncbi:unnamed protein product [Prunus armeniaca]